MWWLSSAVLLAVVACSASAPDTGGTDAGQGGRPDGASGPPADAEPPGPDARPVECPPGLPDSFDSSGNVLLNKNGPPPYTSYNVFFDLDGNPRWFFAMNLRPDRGVFADGMAPGKYDIGGEDTDVQYCSLCVNLYADYDEADGGSPESLHLFAQKGTLIIDEVSGDEVSGRLEDVLLAGIDIVYDEESVPCGAVDDDVCVNTICINNECGRQVGLVGCSTSIQRLNF